MITYPTNKLQKVLLRGGCVQRNLPSGFTQVEYLETDGNSYIDTGVLLNNTDPFNITFQSSKHTLTSPVMGAISGGTFYGSPNNICVTYNVGNNVNSYSVYCDGKTGNANFCWNGGNYADKLKHTIKYTGLNIAPTIDGVAMTQLIPTTLTTSNATITTWLFGRNNIGSGSMALNGVRIFDTNFYAKGHFIPCRRNSDSVLGIYDTVTGNFLTNAGTGTFTAGADVVPTPDTPMDIVCNNGAIKVSRNLWNPNKVQGGWIKTDNSISSVTNGKYIRISAKAGDEYTLSATWSSPSGNNFLVISARDNNDIGLQRWVSTSGNASVTLSITAPINTEYLVFAHYITIPETIQLEQGPTTTTYMEYGQIYTDGTQEVVTDNLGNTASAEMLLAVGDYKDTQEVISGSVTRNIGVKVLDGTETYSVFTSSGKTSVFLIHIANSGGYGNGNPQTVTSSHFISNSVSTGSMGNLTVFERGDSQLEFFIRYDLYDNDVDGFKAWIIDQYNAGQPVVIVYPLATSTTEQVTPQPLTGNTATVTAGSIDNLPIESSTIAELKKRYIGDKEVKKVYIGDNLVWENK